MMILVRGVRLLGIRSELVIAMVIVDGLYTAVNETLVITSVVDGAHMRNSLHYVGAAFDFKVLSEGNTPMRNRIADALGPDYDVVLEHDHFHVEWQPEVGV